MRGVNKDIQIDFDFTPTGSQRELLRAVRCPRNKYIVANFSRQQGKTTIIKAITINFLFKINYKIGYITPTKKLAKQIYCEIKEIFERTDLINRYDGVFLTMKSVCGTTLSFFSAEQLNAIRGQTFDVLIIDEAAFMKNSGENDIWYNVLWPTVKVKGRKIIMISTPCGKTGFFYDFAMRGLRGDSKIQYIKKTIYEDGLISLNEIEDLKAHYPRLAWQQEFMCEFLDNAISAIPDFAKRFVDFVYDKTQPQWMGIDLSANGEDNTIVTWINESGQTRQMLIDGNLEEKYEGIAKCINTTDNLQKCYIEKNGIGAPMINEIMKKVNNTHKVKQWLTTNTTKTDIINLLSVKVTNDEISFQKDDQQLYGEFSTFTYQLTRSKNIIYAAKNGFHDDRVMSMAIALIAREENKRRYNVSQDTIFIKNCQRASYL